MSVTSVWNDIYIPDPAPVTIAVFPSIDCAMFGMRPVISTVTGFGGPLRMRKMQERQLFGVFLQWRPVRGSSSSPRLLGFCMFSLFSSCTSPTNPLDAREYCRKRLG